MILVPCHLAFAAAFAFLTNDDPTVPRRVPKSETHRVSHTAGTIEKHTKDVLSGNDDGNPS